MSKIFSFFSGCGLLDLGFEEAGFEIVFANEFHPPFLEAYKFARESMGINTKNTQFDSTSIESILENPDTLESLFQKYKKDGEIVGFIGGPPCPDFSIGGKNKGENGENGKLTKTYFELINYIEPDWFIFENVKGLYRTKIHRNFFEKMKAFIGLKYDFTECLFNSIQFNAPQDRQRIVMFGIKKNGNIKKPTDLDISQAAIREETPLNFEFWPLTTPFGSEYVPKIPPSLEHLTVEHWFKKNDVTNHPNASDHFMPRKGLQKFKVVDEGDVSKKSYKRLHRYRYSPTAAYGNNEVHLHPTLERRISVAEALAIQSAPKNFCLPKSMSLTNKFKTIGNAVPFLMGKGIADFVRRLI